MRSNSKKAKKGPIEISIQRGKVVLRTKDDGKVICVLEEEKILNNLYNLYYNPKFVCFLEQPRKCKILNLHTGKTKTIRIDFPYESIDFGSRYAFFQAYCSFFRRPGEVYALYDLKTNQWLKKHLLLDEALCVSDDFLDGKTPFYYVFTLYNRKGKYDCMIYNVDKPIQKVRYYRDFYVWYDMDCSYMEDIIPHTRQITAKGKYISDTQDGFIRFYEIKENDLELVDTLELDKNCIYITHLVTCGTKFVIFETDENLGGRGRFKRIFLYDVSTKKIEYENRYYESHALDIDYVFGDPESRDFIEHLLRYANGLQDSFLHIFENEKGQPELMPIEKWKELQRLKKVANEIAKAFRVPKQEPQPKLVI